MGRELTSQIIGQLQQDNRFRDWWYGSEFEIPFFDNKKLPIRFTDCKPDRDKTFVEEADNALSHFFKLTNDNRQAISSLVNKNRMDNWGVMDADGTSDATKDPHKIWDSIHPVRISVTRRLRKEKDIYVVIDCECDWDLEHGLQLVFRQGKKLTRISQQDGHITEADAYGKPDEQDELLSKFNE